MTPWNFHMSEAPKGRTEQRERIRDGAKVPYTVLIPAKIIAADANSEVVTVSYWLPDEERWAMFTKETPPVAWQPWPDHPSLEPSHGQ